MRNFESDETSPLATAGTPLPQSARAAMLIVFLVVVIDLLGFGIVLPLLPRIAKSYVSVALPSATQQAPVVQESTLPEHTELIGYSAAGLSLVALLLGIWLLPETRRF